MALTYFYAQLFGIIIGIMGLGMLVNRSMMAQAMREMIENRGVLLITGLVTLLFGVVIILTHNIWVGTLAIVVSLLGWLLALKGALFMLLPHATLRRIYAGEWTGRAWPLLSVVVLVIGAYLIYNGFWGW